MTRFHQPAVHKRYTLRWLLLLLCATSGLTVTGAAAYPQMADYVLVDKSDHKLYLYSAGKIFAAYPVVFGPQPKGPKRREGDERTPEGRYLIDYKKPVSKFYKALHISYPNERDIAESQKLGVSPGGNIMIHGQTGGVGIPESMSQQFNWTNGCIALSNNDMDKVWDAVQEQTRILIRP